MAGRRYRPAQIHGRDTERAPARALAADLGAARSYLTQPVEGNLAVGEADRYAFAVRPSEFRSTASGDVYLGIILEAQAGSALVPGLPIIEGRDAVASGSETSKTAAS